MGEGKYSKFSICPSNVELVEENHLKAIRGGNGINTNTKCHTCLEQCDNQAMLKNTRGGYDNKYRKLRGIGEYSKAKPKTRQGTEYSACIATGNAQYEQQDSECG